MQKQIKLMLVSLLILASSYVYGKPTVTIITSVFKGDAFIEGFMHDIVRQTIFDQCELIMINANSPEHEEKIIKQYMQQYKNIIYIKLDNDPGIYGVWNLAIEMAQGDYITNANLDDRLKPDCYEIHAKALNEHPEIDLAYSDFYITQVPNSIFEKPNAKHRTDFPDFSKKNMLICLPNNHPMWRKSLHARYGLFDASYISSGDHEMWLRAVAGGAKFLKVPGVYGVLYLNPNGLSNKKDKTIELEKIKVCGLYKQLFGLENLSDKEVFDQLVKEWGKIFKRNKK